MKKLFFLIIFTITFASFCYADTIEFSDIQNHWAKETIYEMVAGGAVSGYEDGTFKPDKEVTIAEFLKILVDEENYKYVTNGNRWPDWYVDTAIYNGLISKNDFDNYFAILSRKDAVKIISNYIDLKDVKKSSNSFSDLSKENKEKVLKLNALGIINGFQDGTFRENDSITRAQACKIIHQAYNAKNNLLTQKAYKVTAKNSNIGEPLKDDVVTQNRYEIKNGRIYINDTGRYAKLSNTTLNQEYINDKLVIKTINAMVDDYSYTEVIYVPDKYIINTLNICYGQRQDYVNNGVYTFQVRFFENGNYNLRKGTGIEKFTDKAFVRIELDRMWDKSYELDGALNASEKNLNKVENVYEALFGKTVASKLRKITEEKLVDAANTPDDEFDAKIAEVTKIGNYVFNIYCFDGQRLQIYAEKN